MKLFNLEEAKAGKPVVTRDGKPVRILVFDRNGDGYQPIIALVDYGNYEQLFSYHENGCLAYGVISDGNLVMKSEKKEGWINLYGGYDGINANPKVFCTEHAARIDAQDPGDLYVATVKVEWEE